MTKVIVVEWYVINVPLWQNNIISKNVILEDSIATLVITVLNLSDLNKKFSLFFHYSEIVVRYIIKKYR